MGSIAPTLTRSACDANGTTSGETAVEPGTYHEVGVIANETEGGNGWTITFTTGQ